jgi:methionyl-tRNA formyltransferase
MRLVFMGTAELACNSLRALLARSEFSIRAVVTQPDRPKGRDLKVQPSPVKKLAVEAGLPVLQPERARHPEFIAALEALAPELIVVAAYGQILPSAILTLPHYGCLNVHTSLLPKYRGAAPIQRAILNDEPETGVTIMKLDVGLDTGPMLTQERTPIYPEDTAPSLHDRLAELGARLLVETIPGFVAGSIVPRPQPAEGVSLAPKITKEEGRIDWTQPARAVWNRVRGLVPWPGTFCWLETGGERHLLKIWQAEVVDLQGEPGALLRADKTGIVAGCGTGALKILQLQREGGRRLTAEQFLAGCPLTPGRHRLAS